MSFDGCKTIKVPDTARNRAWLGKMNAALGETGYPVIQLMTLVETGTRALLGAVFGATAVSELDWARQLRDGPRLGQRRGLLVGHAGRHPRQGALRNGRVLREPAHRAEDVCEHLLAWPEQRRAAARRLNPPGDV